MPTSYGYIYLPGIRCKRKRHPSCSRYSCARAYIRSFISRFDFFPFFILSYNIIYTVIYITYYTQCFSPSHILIYCPRDPRGTPSGIIYHNIPGYLTGSPSAVATGAPANEHRAVQFYCPATSTALPFPV